MGRKKKKKGKDPNNCFNWTPCALSFDPQKQFDLTTVFLIF